MAQHAYADVQSELEDVLRRKDAAEVQMHTLQCEIVDLGKEIDSIKAERAEAMRLAAQEARVTPGEPYVQEARVTPGEPYVQPGTQEEADLQAQLIRLAMRCPNVPGVSGLLQAVQEQGIPLSAFGEPSGPVRPKRSAAATPLGETYRTWSPSSKKNRGPSHQSRRRQPLLHRLSWSSRRAGHAAIPWWSRPVWSLPWTPRPRPASY